MEEREDRISRRESFRQGGLVLLGVLLSACGIKAQTQETSNPPSTATSPNSTESPTATTTRTPEPTSTPEQLNFKPYAVYMGKLTEVAGGSEKGNIMISYLPDGTFFSAYFAGLTSGAWIIDPRVLEVFGESAPDYFVWSLPGIGSISGKLETPQLLSGRFDIEIPSSKKDVRQFLQTAYKAEFVGVGRDNLVEEFRTLYHESRGRVLSLQETEELINQMCGCQLP